MHKIPPGELQECGVVVKQPMMKAKMLIQFNRLNELNQLNEVRGRGPKPTVQSRLNAEFGMRSGAGGTPVPLRAPTRFYLESFRTHASKSECLRLLFYFYGS
jgi:hypothetical protein